MAKYDFLSELDIGWRDEVVTHPLSGQSMKLDPVAVAVFDYVLGSEMLASMQDRQKGEDGYSPLWEGVREGLAWFRAERPEAYMRLLD